MTANVLLGKAMLLACNTWYGSIGKLMEFLATCGLLNLELLSGILWLIEQFATCYTQRKRQVLVMLNAINTFQCAQF
jgi:hypothetical protein